MKLAAVDLSAVRFQNQLGCDFRAACYLLNAADYFFAPWRSACALVCALFARQKLEQSSGVSFELRAHSGLNRHPTLRWRQNSICTALLKAAAEARSWDVCA